MAYGQKREFLGLETELLPLLPGGERFTRSNLHQDEGWNVKEQEVIRPSMPLKGQKFSTIHWENIEPEKWMDFDIWKSERELKDNVPEWQLRVRHVSQNEHVGKVLHCTGECKNFRNSDFIKAVHLSRINEGDEFHTSKNSAAWIYLMDGSLLRVGPESSVTFQEINIGQDEILVYLRLNQGQIHWSPRANLKIPDSSLPETDIFSLPLIVKEANQEFFEIKLFRSQNDKQHLVGLLNLNQDAINLQIKGLEELRSKNNLKALPATKVIAVTPQVSLIGKKTHFDLLYLPGHVTYFKRRTSHEGDEFQISLRGYTNTELVSINESAWYSMDKTGRNYEKVDEVPPELQLIELLTARVKTIELAREFWYEKYSSSIYNHISQKNAQQLASDYGYVLWGDDYLKRTSFLLDYSRRIETTYLKALDNLQLKLGKSGEVISKGLDSRFHEAALNDYLNYLKTRYSIKRTQIREMSDLQFYIWALKKGAGVIR
jgi:hypothetical protein